MTSTRPARLVLPLLLLALASCGGGSTTAASTATTATGAGTATAAPTTAAGSSTPSVATASTAPDSCSVVSAADVDAAFGVTTAPVGVTKTVGAFSLCRFGGSENFTLTGALADLTVQTVITPGGVDGFDQAYLKGGVNSTGYAATDKVAGLGQLGYALTVPKGGDGSGSDAAAVTVLTASGITIDIRLSSELSSAEDTLATDANRSAMVTLAGVVLAKV